MNNLKKDVQKELKKNSLLLDFNGIDIKYKNDSINFIDQKSDIGYLGYTFVSNKFSDFGSLFGIYISCRFGKEMKDNLKIVKIINNLDLSYSGKSKLPNCYFGFTSLYYLSNKFYNKGTVSFSVNDDVNVKCVEIVKKIKELYLPKIQNFIFHKEDLIDDILDFPENYSYPMAFLLTICYLNNKVELIEEIIKKSKSKKMCDNNQLRIHEIKQKLEKYFGDVHN